MEKNDIRSLKYQELQDVMKELSEQSFRTKQIFEWIHKKQVRNFAKMTNLSKNLRKELEENYLISKVEAIDQKISKDGETRKFLFELEDKRVIESVWMHYRHGNSVCISSQVGCRMGCSFCASAIGGLERNLTVSEMLGQIYEIQTMTQERVSNVVIMGTGEPFDNYNNVLKMIGMISDERGMNISQRNITMSTCGIVDKIMELAKEKLQITLAISLHGPNDQIRRKLMPVANKYKIEDIIKACQYYFEKTGRRITFEYSLVQDVNDSKECARELSKLVKGLNCHINLIPVNPIKERNYTHSNDVSMQNFKNILEKNRINVTIRREMGMDIDAACGQLRKRYMDGNQIVSRLIHEDKEKEV